MDQLQFPFMDLGTRARVIIGLLARSATASERNSASSTRHVVQTIGGARSMRRDVAHFAQRHRRSCTVFRQNRGAWDLTELRHTDPVRWTQPSDYRPFWALTKHADIMEVERQSSKFIVGPRNEEEERARAKTGGKPLMRTLPTMDDPDHRKYRNVTRCWFQPGSSQKLGRWLL
jgi:cytochrome P450